MTVKQSCRARTGRNSDAVQREIRRAETKVAEAVLAAGHTRGPVGEDTGNPVANLPIKSV